MCPDIRSRPVSQCLSGLCHPLKFSKDLLQMRLCIGQTKLLAVLR